MTAFLALGTSAGYREGTGWAQRATPCDVLRTRVEFGAARETEDVVRKTSIPSRVTCIVAVTVAVGGVLAAGIPVATADPTPQAGSWYLRAMHVPDAQRLTTGRGVTVAVVDAGVDASVPELAGRVVPGYDAAGGDGRRDATGHGTGVASLVAGAGGDGRVLGVARDARIMPVVLPGRSDGGSLHGTALRRGVRWAVDHGARVVVLPFSVTGTDPSATWRKDLVGYAARHGAVLVAAAGERSRAGRSIGAPADIRGVVAVTGLSRGGRAWPGSAAGSAAVVSAPAENITVATGRSGGSRTVSDTGAAAGLVAGELALIMAHDPGVSAADAIGRLIGTVRELGGAGRDPVFGFGAVDPLAALTRAVPPVDRNPLLAGPATTGPATASTPVTPSASPSGGSDGSGSTVVAVIVVAILLLVVLVVVIVTLRSRRGGGGNGGGGGGGGGGPDGPPSPGPGGGPVGYRQPDVPAWQHPTIPSQPTGDREPVPAGR